MAGPQQAGDTRRVGGWLPAQDDLEAWLEELAAEAEAMPTDAPLRPAVARFRALIDRDPVVRLHVSQMVEQVPDVAPYTRPHVRGVADLLRMVDLVTGRAPEYREGAMVGVPLNAVLDACMRTPAGTAAFRHDAINAALRDVLRAWCDYLSGPESLAVLNTSPRGWMCEAARRASHIEDFEHDPGAPHWGFASWNDFFFALGALPDPHTGAAAPLPVCARLATAGGA